MRKIVLVTGGFDPIHSGHIEYLKAAKKLGDTLIVGLNSDAWLTRKKGQPFMSIDERFSILSNLRMVDKCIQFNDDDGTAIAALEEMKLQYPSGKIIFANGGDRTADNIPEMSVKGIEFAFGVGGDDKKNSSSWILNKWENPKTVREWGHWRVLYDVPGCKAKELVVEPGKRLSMQQHDYRSELWFVAEGTATVHWDEHGSTKIKKHKTDTIQKTEWHQLINETDVPLKIVEIQYGLYCDESDIKRR